MSSELSVRARDVGKRYTIVHDDRVHTSLAEKAVDRVLHPLHRVRREAFWALRDVSFDVERGEVLGIIGPNGAGKSTLLKIMSRITPPTEGRIELHGRVGSLLEVGTGFHKELTGRENIYLNGGILGMRKREIDRAFDTIVEFSGIERFLDTPVKRYSSGMYVRLAFAVAAHLEPEILIVDEVLAVGDIEFQAKCLGRMSEISRAGRTVLFVSHNMNAVLELCSRVVQVEGGRLVRSGPAAEVVNAYLEDGARRQDFDVSTTSREGDGRARVVDFEISPDPPSTGARTELHFTLERTAPGDRPLPVELGIGLTTREGTKILETYSRNVGAAIRLPPGRTRVTASIDCLPLVPGSYRLNLWVGSGATCIDFVRDAFVLEVRPGTLAGDTVAEDFGFPVSLPMHWGAASATPVTLSADR